MNKRLCPSKYCLYANSNSSEQDLESVWVRSEQHNFEINANISLLLQTDNAPTADKTALVLQVRNSNFDLIIALDGKISGYYTWMSVLNIMVHSWNIEIYME